MIESIEALNLILEEDIVETINHRLLTSLLENYLDVDQLNNSWSTHALPTTYKNEHEFGITHHDASSPLEPSTTAPPRPPKPPKPSHPAEYATKHQPIIERSRDFSQILTKFANHVHNSSSTPFARTAKNVSMRPELPPRPEKPIPSSKHVEPDTIQSHSPQNNQNTFQNVKEKPSKSNSSPSKIARTFFKSIVSSSSNPPKAPPKDFAHQVPAADTADTYSDHDDHIYEAIKPRAPINASPDNFVTDADRENTRSVPESEERVAPGANNHEINARIVSQEFMSNLKSNRNVGVFSKVPKPSFIAEETENLDNIYQDDSRRHESRKEQFSKRENNVTMTETLYESPDEFDFRKLNSSPGECFTRSENSNCLPVEEVFYNTPENVYYEITNSLGGPVQEMPNDTLEKTSTFIVDNVEYDDIFESVYYNAAEDVTAEKRRGDSVGKMPNDRVEKTSTIIVDNVEYDDTFESAYYNTAENVYCQTTEKTRGDSVGKMPNDRVEKTSTIIVDNVEYDDIFESAYYNTAENIHFETAEKTRGDSVGKTPNDRVEKTSTIVVDNVEYDDTFETYYDTTAMEQYDPITCWDTVSTVSSPCSWLAEEPLYQLTEAYGSQQKRDHCVSTYGSPDRNNSRRFSDELEQIHSRKVNGRTLWCKVGSVIAANVLDGMSRREIDLQEAKFEIYTTEFSFLKSLKLLKRHFIMSSEFASEKILSKSDRGELFMYVKPLMARSKAFLRDLDDCWNKSIFMNGIFDVICKHANKNFDIYITYCSYLNDTIEKLNELSSGKSFLAALKGLEQSEQCYKLSLLSFLTLPMERITSMDLLIKKALSALTKEDKSLDTRKYDTDHDTCLLASDYVKKVCEKSNEACEIKRRIKKLIQLSTAFSYSANVCPLSLISQKRWLIMFGDVSKLDWVPGERQKIPSAIVRSMSSVGIVNKANYTIFLFNDYLVLAKKRNSDGSSFMVIDYCRRQHAKIVLPSTLPTSLARSVLDYNKQYKMLLVMYENHEKKKVEMLLSCALKRERDLWVTSISEKVKAAVGPQRTPMPYVCVYPFSSEEENQLSLVKGDEVMVIKKLGCGWLEGVRTRDKKTGMFPPSRVQLVQSRPKARVETVYYC